jgi:hypothetical protein
MIKTDFSRYLENLSLNLSPKRRETLNFPPATSWAGWFHTSREKLKLDFKASPPVGERFGEGSKSMVLHEKSRLRRRNIAIEFLLYLFFKSNLVN